MRARLITLLRTLVTLAAGAAILFVGLFMLGTGSGLVPGVLIEASGLSLDVDILTRAYDDRLRWLAWGVGITLIGCFITLVSIVRARPAGPVTFAIQDRVDAAYDDMHVTISRDSLRALVAFEANRLKGVYDIDPDVALARKGWTVRCRVSVLQDAELPVLLPALKQRLRDALQHHTGIPIGRLDIHTQHESLHHSGHSRLR